MKLIMMKGLPASGKSTRAAEIVASGGQFIRLNRDLLRSMLHFDRWTGKNEGVTVNAERALAANALSNGYNVVVDDCNLNPGNAEMWKQLAKECDATFHIENFATPVEVCIERDISREKSVGRHIIENMALQYGLFPKPEKPFVLCDIDGTLADCMHRIGFVKNIPEGQKKNWKSFFEAMPNDTLIQSTKDMLDKYRADGHQVILVSARPEAYRTATMKWLLENGMDAGGYYKALIMRRDNDSRDDIEVKGEYHDKFFKDKYDIETVIDDRPKVIRMWRERGIPVIDVGAGIEF